MPLPLCLHQQVLRGQREDTSPLLSPQCDRDVFLRRHLCELAAFIFASFSTKCEEASSSTYTTPHLSRGVKTTPTCAVAVCVLRELHQVTQGSWKEVAFIVTLTMNALFV